MGLIATFRNAVRWAGFDLGRHDQACAQAVVLVNPDTGEAYSVAGSEVDRELVVTTYVVKTAFTGASVGDTITFTQILDISATPAETVSSIWRNQTTLSDLASAPSAANLELTGSTALTAAQLAAAGLGTAANQVTQLDRTDIFGGYILVKTEDLGAGVKYILKVFSGGKWVLIRKQYTATDSTFDYAGPNNNTGVTAANAWTNRASTVVYGDPFLA